MLAQLLIRFCLGGAIVSAFAVAGELFQPKRFAGMSAAAPSVALATLALTYFERGNPYVAVEGRSMLIGAVALLAYCASTVVAAKARAVPIWLAALAAWAVWLGVALGLWGCGVASGALR